jgi:hypothetical protein
MAEMCVRIIAWENADKKMTTGIWKKFSRSPTNVV